MFKVAKFGGSSVANSEQFKKIKKIVESDKTRRFVVTSACGKESNEDYKVTDLLYLTHAHLKYGVDYKEIFKLVEKKYKTIVENLNLTVDIEKEFDEIKSKMSKNMSIDYLVSRGEYLAAVCLSNYLGFELMDAKDFICFDYDNKINLKSTNEKFHELYDTNKFYVFPGFYGAMPNGEIRVMSRGGSDITGSIIANIADCYIYENWTDVSGILACDPRIVKNPKNIPYISYDELREISYMGANVLHDEAIFPAKEKNIPINIRNTNDMDNPGTMIMKDLSEEDKLNPPPVITGITGKKDFCAISVKKSNISSEAGFLRKALQIFEDFSISIESVPASVDAFSVVVESSKIEKYLYEIITKLKSELGCEEINVAKDIALVAAVGRAFVSNKGLAGRIFKVLGDNDINIKIINQGADEINITMGVDNKDFEKTINCIYDKFLRGE